MKPTLKELNTKLLEAARLLDDSATIIRDLDFSRKINIRKIGESLANIYDICNQIYLHYPDLAPDYLKRYFDEDKK